MIYKIYQDYINGDITIENSSPFMTINSNNPEVIIDNIAKMLSKNSNHCVYRVVKHFIPKIFKQGNLC